MGLEGITITRRVTREEGTLTGGGKPPENEKGNKKKSTTKASRGEVDSGDSGVRRSQIPRLSGSGKVLTATGSKKITMQRGRDKEAKGEQ